jgi:hypothetical protein
VTGPSPTVDGDREVARRLLQTALAARLENVRLRSGVLMVKDRRGLASELVETLCEPKYRQALQALAEGPE